MYPVIVIFKAETAARFSGLVLAVLLVGVQAALAGPFDFNPEDTVTITADRAWEAQEPNVIHFSGKFVLHAPDWSMTGDTAVVYGELDDPDRVVVEGKPATVSILRESDAAGGETDPGERVKGEANRVEYLRSTDRLIMKGSAWLLREESKLGSERIEYDVDTDRYSAGGEGGINFEYTPEE